MAHLDAKAAQGVVDEDFLVFHPGRSPLTTEDVADLLGQADDLSG